MAGYAFAKLQFRGRDRLLRICCWRRWSCRCRWACCRCFCCSSRWALINTYWAVILPSMATIYGIFMVRQYALSIPDSLLDAARIDGAGELRIFFSIVLPLDPAGAGHAGDFYVSVGLERLYVAADRADRQRPLHAAGGAWRSCRASMSRTPN